MVTIDSSPKAKAPLQCIEFKVKTQIYHPFAALPRATEDSEETQEKNLEGSVLAFTPKKSLGLRFHPRPSACICG